MEMLLIIIYMIRALLDMKHLLEVRIKKHFKQLKLLFGKHYRIGKIILISSQTNKKIIILN